MQTSYGAVVIELDPHKAPKTVNNFIAYVRDGYYDGTMFHRIIDDFMVQGGGFLPGMIQKPTRPAIENEAKNGLRNERGTISMARTNEPDSATAQFFINLKDNDFLNHGSRDFGYAVFGKVTGGVDVVKKIAAVKTAGRGGHEAVPVEPVVIKSAKRS
jgi:cyclophilin family peptidyl-prolyl cis-trans isomerase